METPKIGLTVESLERHERFLSRVVAGGSVWVLREPPSRGGGWVHSTSNGDRAGRGGGRPIVPMWSDRAYARQCATRAWAKCVPVELPLAEFLSAVLPNMHKAKVLVGTNWNVHLIGHEIPPKKLLTQLQAEVKRTGITKAPDARRRKSSDS
ncbi:DUF2750 domain-containing protein [Usitatibacter palustris]|uniref:DUF2750 domain-containing protein n=1 Tax=Usitatibacter palustris TaxID=2732487 RepID=UPI00148905AC